MLNIDQKCALTPNLTPNLQKMQTRTLAELVRMAEKLGIESVRSR